jgi:hypothetical protein
MKTTINLGAEYDVQLQEMVHDVLLALGARLIRQSWGVGGSQEIFTRWYKLGWKVVTVEGETYIGLSITGEAELVREIAEKVRSQINNPPPRID